MIFIRILLILYVVPLMLITAFAYIFGKTEIVQKIWIYGTLIILALIVFLKIIFSLISLVE